MKPLPEYLPQFFEAFTAQIKADQERWGQTWARRPLEGQEDRIFARFHEYYRQWAEHGMPIPWLKIVGEAFIAWVRETQDFIQE